MSFPSSRRRAALSALLGLLLAGVVLAAGDSDAVTATDPADALPTSTGSAAVARTLAELPEPPSLPAVAVYSRTDGADLTAADLAAARRSATALGSQAVTAPDGAVATAAVPVPSDLVDEALVKRVRELREQAREDLSPPLQVQVTGAPAFTADLAQVFEGADGRLLAATASVVALLLLVTYRSPVLWILPLLVVGLADRVALVAGGALARATDLQVDAATVGILSVLVFGAGTDYALLLVSRYRDELRRTADRFAAMRAAWRATAPAVLASGGTVALALLALLVSDVPVTRGLGAVCALGVAIAVAFALLLLPPLLVLPGRGLFWPLVPRPGDPLTSERAGAWRAVGRVVVARPVPVLVVAALVLLPLLAPLAGVRTGLAPDEQFREVPEAVVGQQVLARSLPGGSTSPLVVLTGASAAQDVARTAGEVDGVARADVDRIAGDRALLAVVLDAPPGTPASDAALDRLRDALDGRAVVGGETAEALDLERASAADTRLAVPLVVLVVLLVLVALLRALVAPVLLVVTVVLTWAAALGGGWLLFRTVFDFAALDTGVPLLTFLFLVALGVDYGIFLTTRVREEVLAGATTSQAAVRALAATGGVITSAGVLLAAVFAVLGVLPVLALTQIGVVVGLGVLLDTLLVRTVVVPALAAALGDRFWWPGRPRQRTQDAPAAPAELVRS